MAKKLFYIWWLVLLRGLVDAALAAVLFTPALHTFRSLAPYVGAIILAGGLLEIIMFVRLRGHAFQGIFRMTGLFSTLIGGYLFLASPVAREMLLVTTGLWMTVRGFAGLWLGLSIVQRPLDRALPLVAGLASIGFGATIMLWLEPEPEPYVWLVALYAFGSAVTHLGVALRIRMVRTASAV